MKLIEPHHEKPPIVLLAIIACPFAQSGQKIHFTCSLDGISTKFATCKKSNFYIVAEQVGLSLSTVTCSHFALPSRPCSQSP